MEQGGKLGGGRGGARFAGARVRVKPAACEIGRELGSNLARWVGGYERRGRATAAAKRLSKAPQNETRPRPRLKLKVIDRCRG